MKHCGRCHLEKSEDEFNLRDARTGRRHSICNECRRVYCRNYYYADPARFNARKRVRMKGYRERNRRYIKDFLRTHPCVDCGEGDPVVLEFDHVRGVKNREISILVSEGTGIHILALEIAKCVVRCANCHRRRTSAIHGYWKQAHRAGERQWPVQSLAVAAV
ncbi:MAG: hypothetical protein JO225_08175, partial [Candidatus Eremiobacteraeota bacterium]|nr:hypothetical protein [Candidatus Eremiobacteraeota bacterium]